MSENFKYYFDLIDEYEILDKKIIHNNFYPDKPREPILPQKPYVLKKWHTEILKKFIIFLVILILILFYLNFLFFEKLPTVFSLILLLIVSSLFFIIINIDLFKEVIFYKKKYKSLNIEYLKEFKQYKKNLLDYPNKINEYKKIANKNRPYNKRYLNIKDELFEHYLKTRLGSFTRSEDEKNLHKKYQSLFKKEIYEEIGWRLLKIKAERHKKIFYDEKLKTSQQIKSTNDFITKSLDEETENEKVNKIIHIYSAICSVTAIQPIPFADVFILTPIQAVMGNKIAKIRGYSISEKNIEIIIKEIIGIIGMGIIAQQIAIGSYKTIIPFAGALTTIPMVYGLTYGIGKTIDYYIKSKIDGKTPDKEIIKQIFAKSNKEGKIEGEKRKKEILSNKNEKYEY